jgi:hypothetical protein
LANVFEVLRQDFTAISLGIPHRYQSTPAPTFLPLPGFRELVRGLSRDSRPIRQGRPSRHVPARAPGCGRRSVLRLSTGGRFRRAICSATPSTRARRPNASAQECFDNRQLRATSRFARYGIPRNSWRGDRHRFETPLVCAHVDRPLEAGDRRRDGNSCSADWLSICRSLRRSPATCRLCRELIENRRDFSAVHGSTASAGR